MPCHRHANSSRGVLMCAKNGLPAGLSAPTATARSLGQEFGLHGWPLELWVSRGEAPSTPAMSYAMDNWTNTLCLAGAVVRHRVVTWSPGRLLTPRFSCKVGALLETTLEEVLFLDSDAALIRSPRDLFRSAEYQRTGTLFMNDRQLIWTFYLNPVHEKAHAWLRKLDFAEGLKAEYAGLRAVERTERRGLPSRELFDSQLWAGTSSLRADSGVWLVDRRRQERLLAVLRKIYRQVERFSHGDKESYWIAAELANTQYAFSPFAPGQLLRAPVSNSTCCGLFVHFDPSSGEPFVVHGVKNPAEYLTIGTDNLTMHTQPSRDTQAYWTSCRPHHTAPRPPAGLADWSKVNARWKCNPGGATLDHYEGSRDVPAPVPFSDAARRLLVRRTGELADSYRYFSAVFARGT